MTSLKVCATAPGKVILFGDHAVVYGRSAIAASVSDLRVQVNAELVLFNGSKDSFGSGPSIVILLHDLPSSTDGSPLSFSTSVAELEASLGFLADPSACSPRGSMQARTPPHTALAALSSFLEVHGRKQKLASVDVKALSSALFLAASIALPALTNAATAPPHQQPSTRAGARYGLELSVSSVGLPVGAGLGSSAALSVATAAALLRLTALLANNTDTTDDDTAADTAADAAAAVGVEVAPEKKKDNDKDSHRHSENSHHDGASGDDGDVLSADSMAWRVPIPSSSSSSSLSSSSSSVSSLVPAHSCLEVVNEWAFAAEVVMTGHPSGVDNTVCCFGRAVRYRKASALTGHKPLIEFLALGSGTAETAIGGGVELEVLLTNTKVPKDTKKLVAAVQTLRGSSPCMGAVVDSVFDSIEHVSNAFLQTVKQLSEDGGGGVSSGDDGGGGGEKTKKKGGEGEEGEAEAAAATLHQLVRMNQDLLNSLGVGHPALDVVVREGRKRGFESKLTGAGGGGCAYTLLKPWPHSSSPASWPVASPVALRLQQPSSALQPPALVAPSQSSPAPPSPSFLSSPSPSSPSPLLEIFIAAAAAAASDVKDDDEMSNTNSGGGSGNAGASATAAQLRRDQHHASAVASLIAALESGGEGGGSGTSASGAEVETRPAAAAAADVDAKAANESPAGKTVGQAIPCIREQRGFSCYRSALAGPGVLWVEPPPPPF